MDSTQSQSLFSLEEELPEFSQTKSNFSDISSTVCRVAYHSVSHPTCASTQEPGVPHHFPFATQPFPFPASFRRKAVALVPIINKLFSRVAADYDFLERIMAPTAVANPDYSGRLLKILKACQGKQQPIQLDINRTDYLRHDRYGENKMAMVEVNTIGPVFAAYMSAVQDLHQPSIQEKASKMRLSTRSDAELANALCLAHRKFLEINTIPKGLEAVIAVVAGPRSPAQPEIDYIRSKVEDRCGVACPQFSFRDICEYGRLLQGQLLMKLPGWKREQVISVAYLRSGFSAFENFVEQQWAGRSKLEHSNAVKCPTVAAQLVGSKRMQQVLTSDTALRQFLDSEEEVNLLKSTLVPHYSLCKSEGGADHANMAIQNAEKFVLKGQNEGVSNLFFSEQMRAFLMEQPEDQLEAFVLTDRLILDKACCSVVRDGKVVEEEVIGELAIWSTHVACNGEVLLNRYAGAGVRLKRTDDEEKGITLDNVIICSAVFEEEKTGEDCTG